MIAIDFGCDDYITNGYVFDTTGHTYKQYHNGVKVRDRPLGLLCGVGVPHTYFDDANFPEVFAGIEQAAFVHVPFRMLGFINIL